MDAEAARPGDGIARPLHDVRRRKGADDALVIVQAQAHLLEIVGALDAAGRLAGGLDGRQEQGDQDRDDRDDHQ